MSTSTFTRDGYLCRCPALDPVEVPCNQGKSVWGKLDKYPEKEEGRNGNVNPLPRTYFCYIVSGVIRRRLKIPVANLHVRHLRQHRWNLETQNPPDKRWERGRNKRGKNKTHRPKSNPLEIPREWMPQRGSRWSCPSNPTQVEGPLEPFWSWDRDWTSHLAPTVLHIGPRTRPYSAAWARGCWKFVAKLFRPTLVSFWFHFFIKVTAGTGGDHVSCLWNRQCRAHSIGLYNARVGVNSNPTGFFFSFSSRSALSWSIPQFDFSPYGVSWRTTAALSSFQPHGEMLLNLVQLMGGFVFFHSSPSPCYIVVRWWNPRNLWSHGELPE